MSEYRSEDQFVDKYSKKSHHKADQVGVRMGMTREELGRRIRSARETCGLTQEQLGEFADLNRVAVGQIEAGSRSVSSLELDRIAHAVGRDIKSFFAESFVERDALAALFRSDAELAEQADLLKALQDSLALGHELTNLERLLGREFQRLKADEDCGAGQAIATFLSAPEVPKEDTSREDFRRRFLALALEAYRREEITRSKLAELAAMVHLGRNELGAALASAKLD